MCALVTCQGRVRAGRSTLVAPLSGRHCVIYQLELTRWQRLREGWLGPSREIASVRFTVKHEDGWLLVDASQATLRLPLELRRCVELGQDALLEARLRAFYHRRGRALRQHVRCQERSLHCGDEVWLRGELVLEPDVAGEPGSYRERPALAVLYATQLVALWSTRR